MEEISEDFEINMKYDKKEQTLVLHSYKSGYTKIIECKNKKQFEKIINVFFEYAIPYKDKEQEQKIEKVNRINWKKLYW